MDVGSTRTLRAGFCVPIGATVLSHIAAITPNKTITGFELWLVSGIALGFFFQGVPVFAVAHPSRGFSLESRVPNNPSAVPQWRFTQKNKLLQAAHNKKIISCSKFNLAWQVIASAAARPAGRSKSTSPPAVARCYAAIYRTVSSSRSEASCPLRFPAFMSTPSA